MIASQVYNAQKLTRHRINEAEVKKSTEAILNDEKTQMSLLNEVRRRRGCALPLVF